jgi:uncharacterized protein (DUF433 family)
MLAHGDSVETLLEGYTWLEREDVLACLEYAYRAVSGEHYLPLMTQTAR